VLGLIESITRRLTTEWNLHKAGEKLTRSYKCRCGAVIFFPNTQCLSCSSPLGFLADSLSLVAVGPATDPGTLRVQGSDRLYKYCGNRESPAHCNWLLEAENPLLLCVACRLNRTIPRLDDPDNVRYWSAIEGAKRRLVSQLLALGLPVKSKLGEDPARGLMFDLLRSPADGPAVMTGHADGLITLNVEEADDAMREKIKHQLHEPYRTLLGHFRHEVGHYYWDRLVSGSKWLEPFRQLFGDERASYVEAVKRHYDTGPPPDWANAYISSYATTHPWEDWAETWAHYLHVVDSLATALSFGLDADDLETRITPFGSEDLYAPDDPGAARFLSMLNAWVEMVMVLNEIARSMGEADFYPFVMSRPVVAKLQLVHLIVFDAQTAAARTPGN
jgi:hypothetical protein